MVYRLDAWVNFPTDGLAEKGVHHWISGVSDTARMSAGRGTIRAP